MSAQNVTSTTKAGALLGMLGLSVIAGLVSTIMVTPAIAVTGIAASNTIGIFESLPEYVQINQLPERNTLYAQNTANPDDGYTAIATVYAQNRKEVEWASINDYVKDATLAGEDRRFYEHSGVDVQSIVRAALGNLSAGGVESGASTLTMQLVKNICIQEALKIEDSDYDAARAGVADCQVSSLQRKLNEAKLAIALEKRFTKDEILLAYLNIAGFGGNTYGIEAAAEEYFGVSAADLSLAQASSLIAIVQQPGARSLRDAENYAANQARRDVILRNMGAYGFVTQAEMDEALSIPVDENFVTLTNPRSGCIAAAEYAKFFCDYVVRNVRNFESLGADEATRRSTWKTGGISVYTTLNLSLQTVAQDAVWRFAPANETALELGAVSISIQPGTGRVLTMAQNKIFDNSDLEAGPEYTAVNFNTDRDYGGSSGFQTGSTYKMFVLLEWLNQGRGLREIVDAAELTYPFTAFTDSCNGIDPSQEYEFANDSGGSAPPMDPVQATRASVNSAFVSMATQLDLCEIRNRAADLGVHRADGGELQTNPSSVLGTNELAPLSMAAAYAGIANDGRYCEPIVVDRFITRAGDEIDGQASKCDQGIDPEVAAAAAFAMATTMVSGGTAVASNPNDGVPVIGKTGTTDASKDTWMIASTTEVATAVWVGNIVGDARLRQYRNPEGFGGGELRHRIMREVLLAANAQYGGNAFPEPPARLVRGAAIELPNLVGQSSTQARAIVESLGLRYAEGAPVDSSQPVGSVAVTTPAAGSLVSKGNTVQVQLSLGNLRVVPDVVSAGYDEAQAKAALRASGFSSISTVCVPINGGPDPSREGLVEAQNPAPGTTVGLDTTITLGVASERCGTKPPPGDKSPTPSPTPTPTPTSTSGTGTNPTKPGNG
jgi:membrane peptidoglycan carboxypeptidase